MKEIWNVRMVNIIWKLTRVSCFCYDCIKTLSGISYSWNTVPVSCLYVRMAHHHSLRLSLLCEHVACCSWCSQEQPTSSYQRQFHLSCVCWSLERNYFEAVKNLTCFRSIQPWEWIGALRREILWLSHQVMPKKGKAAMLALAVWHVDRAYVFSWWSCCPLHSALIRCNEAHLKGLIILQYIIKSQLFMNNASVCAWGQRSMQVI